MSEGREMVYEQRCLERIGMIVIDGCALGSGEMKEIRVIRIVLYAPNEVWAQPFN